MKRRFEKCSGFLQLRVNPEVMSNEGSKPEMNGGRGVCIVRQARTRYYCIGCNHYCCVALSAKRRKLLQPENQDENTPAGASQLYANLGHDARSGEKVAVVKTCAMLIHGEAMRCEVIQQHSQSATNIVPRHLNENFTSP